MIRRAGPEDAGSIETFLRSRAETSMFLRGNLMAHGTEEKTHRHGTTFYLQEKDRKLSAVGGVTNGGFLMCQSVHAPSTFHAAFAAELKGRTLVGMSGAPDEVSAVLDALGSPEGLFSLRVVLPLYALDLVDLQIPGISGVAMRLPLQADLDWLPAWFRGFHSETQTAPPDDPNGTGAAGFFVADKDARLLMQNERPVAMTTFNARAPKAVQIGGVFVPPNLRGQGFGGAVVAHQLDEARRAGTEKAILFAASRTAARVYESIGFQQVGSYELALFHSPWEVPV